MLLIPKRRAAAEVHAATLDLLCHLLTQHSAIASFPYVCWCNCATSVSICQTLCRLALGLELAVRPCYLEFSPEQAQIPTRYVVCGYFFVCLSRLTRAVAFVVWESGIVDKTTKTLLVVFASLGGLCLFCCGGLAIWGWNLSGQLLGTADVPAGMSFQQWRDSRPDDLKVRGPAPQDYDLESPPRGVREVLYQSGDLELKAWVKLPPSLAGSGVWASNAVGGSLGNGTADLKDLKRAPGLIFLHGGFAFGSGDLDAVQLAVDSGFVVMTPMLRGENGNPGSFELFLGEADDAAAAARWLSQQPYVDPNRIFAFGHSVGGGVSAMLSLLDDVPIIHCGSSGGLYPPSVFLGWADIVPFESTPEARSSRLLVSNIRLMQRQHFAYLGLGDSLQDAANSAKAEMARLADPKLKVEMVPGDHFSSFDKALSNYLRECNANP
ncbi:MAG: prolyl oligopeptidase family serine peptidase [Planctomycetota bacterium]